MTSLSFSFYYFFKSRGRYFEEISPTCLEMLSEMAEMGQMHVMQYGKSKRK